ncbi:MAG TPA: helix-turn-helix transcriptional regulator [Bacteroidia bacterium]|jgi:DNA-binding XRE family transcriptional regulator|nr:helix-turn-helix transcriptional regulator [Bacteroidia bacterium]
MKQTKRLPRILKITKIEKSKLRITVLFSSGEDRVLDFNDILSNKWKVKKSDPEYKLYTHEEFSKVRLEDYTLSWHNIEITVKKVNGQKVKMPFQVGADVLYDLSVPAKSSKLSIGAMFKAARKSANLTQEEVANLAGTSRTYITRLENDMYDVEVMTLKKIVEAGLNKSLVISIS